MALWSFSSSPSSSYSDICVIESAATVGTVYRRLYGGGRTVEAVWWKELNGSPVSRPLSLPLSLSLIQNSSSVREPVHPHSNPSPCVYVCVCLCVCVCVCVTLCWTSSREQNRITEVLMLIIFKSLPHLQNQCKNLTVKMYWSTYCKSRLGHVCICEYVCVR